MNHAQSLVVFVLRVTLGWLFLYAGITKIVNPAWSAAGYLNNATTFTDFYRWLASPGILPATNFLNEWGLALIGASLLVGAFVRPAAWLGALLMVLYYFPVMEFPKVDTHYYLVDSHIIYAVALLALPLFNAGRIWGLAPWLARTFPRCRRWV